MKTINRDLVIIGGGPAGLSAAASAYENGVRDILILERDLELGGILNQCIHNGFGLHTFKEELTGPEYADRFIRIVEEYDIEVKLNTMVISLREDLSERKTADDKLNCRKEVIVVSKKDGMYKICAKSVILAMGCRERPRGALNIPGYRPAGVFSAGTAQRLVNIEGKNVGKNVVILGSGDIGLIMARRMTLEGAKVHAVLELMPYSGGLKRNIAQCLNDYNIPLLLSHTVVDIKGKERVEAVVAAEVDSKMNPIPGTEIEYPCDTLLLSVGLLPENEVTNDAGIIVSDITAGPVVDESMETSMRGVFACGNVLHVHDLVDYVSEEAGQAGKKAAEYLSDFLNLETIDDKGYAISIKTDGAVRYTVPSQLHESLMEENQIIRFRVGRPMGRSRVEIKVDDEVVGSKKKMVMAPGEMETVKFKKKWLEGKSCKTITISAVEGE